MAGTVCSGKTNQLKAVAIDPLVGVRTKPLSDRRLRLTCEKWRANETARIRVRRAVASDCLHAVKPDEPLKLAAAARIKEVCKPFDIYALSAATVSFITRVTAFYETSLARIGRSDRARWTSVYLYTYVYGFLFFRPPARAAR